MMPSNQAEKDSYEEAKNRVVNLSSEYLLKNVAYNNVLKTAEFRAEFGLVCL